MQHLMQVSTPSSSRTRDRIAAVRCALACASAAIICVLRPPVRPLHSSNQGESPPKNLLLRRSTQKRAMDGCKHTATYQNSPLYTASTIEHKQVTFQGLGVSADDQERHAPHHGIKEKGIHDREVGMTHRSARDSQMVSRLPGAGGGAGPEMVP